MKKLLILVLVLTFSIAKAQEDKDWASLDQALTLPPHGDNQKSYVKQYIGNIVWVSVTYNSPDVTSPTGENRDRKIWGNLVPYGLTDLGFGSGVPAPWRVGANENTVISFSHDIEIEGNLIQAGSYGLHLIVHETKPWTWIFSKTTQAWGSYSYNQSDDVLRVDVIPTEAHYQEWLNFEFTDRQPESTELSMFWERMRVPLRINVPNMNELYIKTFREELTGAAGFSHQNWLAAARFCALRNYNLDEALIWAENAISLPYTGVKTFGTLQTKGLVLMKLGRAREAEEILIESIKDGNSRPNPTHQLAVQMINLNMKNEALNVFKANYSKFKDEWITSLGMAKGLSALENYSQALKHIKTAYIKASDELIKSQLKDFMNKLKNGEGIN